MKKRLLMLLSLTVLGALLLAGCGTSANQSTTGSNTAAQQQVADDTGSAPATTETTTDANNANNGAAANTASDTAIASYAELEKKALDVIEKADAAAASGNRDADRKLYLEHKSALEAVDRELDVYEDDLEVNYRGGKLTYDEYRAKDAEAEVLEDKLDDAEDRLEAKFGIDD